MHAWKMKAKTSTETVKEEEFDNLKQDENGKEAEHEDEMKKKLKILFTLKLTLTKIYRITF